MINGCVTHDLPAVFYLQVGTFRDIVTEKDQGQGGGAMSTTILCVGQTLHPVEGKYSSQGFQDAVAAEMDSEIISYTGRKYDTTDRIVLIGEGKRAADTAEKLLLPCDSVVSPLLNEIPLVPFTDTEKLFSAEIWLRKAAAQRKHADPRQPESRESVIARAEELISVIERKACILITYPLFLTELLDRLRIHNYVIQRTGFMRIQPLERFLISRKEEHCGGCQHNCFLSSPGCGVGRDKAMRAGIPFSTGT